MDSKGKRFMEEASRYRSGLEVRVAQWITPLGATYESHQVDYVVPKKYTPDFVLEDRKVFVEVKGYFRSGDRQKYKAIAKMLESTEWWFVFILQNPTKKVSKGAKSTMADWCDKHNIKWFAADDASGFELWLEEDDT
jgi:G:T-mismatch repair DNA endonuclease (very short patch repair protein)